MTLTIDLTQAEEARLAAEARRAGLGPARWVKERVTERLPTPGSGSVPPENLASIALLEAWMAEDATDDPEEVRQAERELGEFKRNMNANRRATGERIPYPDVEAE